MTTTEPPCTLGSSPSLVLSTSCAHSRAALSGRRREEWRLEGSTWQYQEHKPCESVTPHMVSTCAVALIAACSPGDIALTFFYMFDGVEEFS